MQDYSLTLTAYYYELGVKNCLLKFQQTMSIVELSAESRATDSVEVDIYKI
jgi:hypothetical protein